MGANLLSNFSMPAAENKALMQRLFSELEKGNVEPFVERLSDDVRWTVAGTIPWSKTYVGKQSVLADLLGPLMSRLGDRLAVTADRFVAEGDVVVIESRDLYSTTIDGRTCYNTYCWFCRIIDGTVCDVTEYIDTELTMRVVGPPPQAG